MKRYNIFYTGLVAITAAMISGCSDSDEWTPGPVDNETGVSAYFVQPEKTSYVFDADGSAANMKIDLTVERLVTDEAVTIPLTVETSAEGFVVPSNLTFAAGQKSASFSIDCSAIPTKKYETVSVILPDDHTDIYGGMGLSDITFSVIKSSWVLISDNVKYSFYETDNETSIYPDIKNKSMYQLEGTFMFRLEDFFGSGIALTFECDKSQDMGLYPLDNCDYESAAGQKYTPWYLYDDKADDWPMWTPGNLSDYPMISYLEFFANDNDTWGSMVEDNKTLSGYFGFLTYIVYTDNNEDYAYLYIDFNLNNNPFE